jgi:secondary thiamine-phosphate synthase enzyme
MNEIRVRTSEPSEFVVITDRVQDAIDESGVKDGVCYVYVPHTTAGVTINENADPMVPHDVLLAVDKLIPMRDPEYRHMEANSAAHVKACFFGSSKAIPIENGRLVLGTWQGIYFCEFDGPRSRKVLVKIIEG